MGYNYTSTKMASREFMPVCNYVFVIPPIKHCLLWTTIGRLCMRRKKSNNKQVAK